MAIGVVVFFEIVDVDHQYAERGLFARGATPFALDIFVKIFSIAQAGKAVDRVQTLQLDVHLRQRAMRLVALQQIRVGLGVTADAGDQLDFVRELDEIVVDAEREGLAFHRRLYFRHRRHGGGGIGAVMKFDIRLTDQRPAYGFTDHCLVVNEQYLDAVLRGRGNEQAIAVLWFSIGHVVLRRQILRANTSTNFEAMRSIGRMSTAAFMFAAAFGMPYTALLAW